MLRSSPDHSPNPLQIKQDDKFYRRILSKESSMTNYSFRVYYGVASGAVPFRWESQPGTPKTPVSSTTLPPLTPPPSYLFNCKKNPTKKPSISKTLNNIFPRLTPRKPLLSSKSSISSSSSASSSWSLSTSSSQSPASVSNIRGHKHFASPMSSFASRVGDEDQAIGSPTSPLCFGVSRHNAGGHRGCYSMDVMKNALLSIIGHGSRQVPV
ncbi:uncharacterized protein LOC143850048 [Tasmannia lanceolata]|uniref:uncharacterized protein LOC143850048 n=1 Tax=Tasmannia lanceolata TaxID=3420 RepID=UPI004063C101